MQKSIKKTVNRNDEIKKEDQQEVNNTDKQPVDIDLDEQIRSFAKMIVSIYILNQENELK